MSESVISDRLFSRALAGGQRLLLRSRVIFGQRSTGQATRGHPGNLNSATTKDLLHDSSGILKLDVVE